MYVQPTQNIWWKYRHKKSPPLALHRRQLKPFGSEPSKHWRDPETDSLVRDDFPTTDEGPLSTTGRFHRTYWHGIPQCRPRQLQGDCLGTRTVWRSFDLLRTREFVRRPAMTQDRPHSGFSIKNQSDELSSATSCLTAGLPNSRRRSWVRFQTTLIRPLRWVVSNPFVHDAYVDGEPTPLKVDEGNTTQSSWIGSATELTVGRSLSRSHSGKSSPKQQRSLMKFSPGVEASKDRL
jgi:hypothetical protein